MCIRDRPGVGPRSIDPFRTTVQAVRGRWVFLTLRMLLLNIGTAFVFTVALIAGFFVATVSIWFFGAWLAIVTVVLLVWSTCGTVAIYRMADGPVDDELIQP